MLMIICFYILLAESILLICLCVPNIRTMIARNFESMSMAEIKPFVSAGSVGAALIGLGMAMWFAAHLLCDCAHAYGPHICVDRCHNRV